ncbi:MULTISPECIES: DUF2399 domain-containing protein [unclassified Streptomyces]|uniref:DUF2399 domain-containing protein n=1 Tax=unclassified Streptomyces TaxID=2593676 RepID=UPI001162C11B|nr:MULTISPECIES: DUF2399 domain-containing protein [unclassified Streptomyces]NMI54247.1 DUF2399 domain-containing protein [Streptomyces sp. RLA2-12]QDN63153.1 DUF2399 domain-containing protein [Streptomyces sp. S1D4-20]QDN73205.1 DUF2399 domain-containing protein [Streptomyces sp. S1D4-14]QDO55803.1 DUF2399 domain-containing protein [Streptomyces sp. RLB3-5]QDO56927.1 DUF2399 domain-containing protein [Streptomyces sp. RLB1-8]
MADLDLIATDPDLAPLWQAVHDRLSAGKTPADITTITVPALSPNAVAALRSWLDTPTQRRRGRTSVPHTPHGLKVPLRPLLDALDLPAEQLQPLVERAIGRKVVNRKNDRLESALLRQELWDYAATRLPHLPLLLARLKATGFENDAAPQIRRLVDALCTLTRELPHQRPRTLAKLAHDHAGDPHYFDLATLPGQRLVSAVAELAGRPEPTRPDHIRALLAEFGIIADRLSATVLLHQVRPTGDGPIDRRLREATAPVALTLLDLTLSPPRLAPTPLTVVENPSILEEALARASTLPLACTSGQLRAVDHALFQLAVDQGVPLRYAGDLDTAGLQIAATVHQLYGAELVAMDATIVHTTRSTPSAVPIGALPPAHSSTELGQALHAGGRIVYQEHDAVLDRLLATQDANVTTSKAHVPAHGTDR